MVKSSKIVSRKKLANSVGIFGYFFCCLELAWILIQKMYLILNYADKYLAKEDASHVILKPIHYNANPTILIILALIMSVLIIGIAIYSLYKAPVAVTGVAERIVHKTNNTVSYGAYKLMQKGDAKKSRKKISARTMFVLKLLIALTPIIICYIFGPSSSDVLSFQIFMLVGLPLALLGAFMFVCQYYIAKSIRLSFDDVR